MWHQVHGAVAAAHACWGGAECNPCKPTKCAPCLDLTWGSVHMMGKVCCSVLQHWNLHLPLLQPHICIGCCLAIGMLLGGRSCWAPPPSSLPGLQPAGRQHTPRCRPTGAPGRGCSAARLTRSRPPSRTSSSACSQRGRAWSGPCTPPWACVQGLDQWQQCQSFVRARWGPCTWRGQVSVGTVQRPASRTPSGSALAAEEACIRFAWMNRLGAVTSRARLHSLAAALHALLREALGAGAAALAVAVDGLAGQAAGAALGAAAVTAGHTQGEPLPAQEPLMHCHASRG